MAISWDLFSPGQGWHQFAALGLAFVLSSLIGLEREFRLRSAGLRTHALVGMGAALMMMVSKYGFYDVLSLEHVALDPSRVAAQIVSGIGFIGGGLIFVRKDIVRGLTTAAVIWVTAGIGMACGAGLPWLALAATAGHFVVAFCYTPLVNKIMGTNNQLRITYAVGHDALSRILNQCSESGFVVQGFKLDQPVEGERPSTTIVLQLQGHTPLNRLVEAVTALPDVLSVSLSPPDDEA